MTRRSRRMLAALEAGCSSRQDIWAHAGGFFLTNNAAAELRRDTGIEVVWDRAADSYFLLDDGERTHPHPLPPGAAAPIVEQESGQIAWDVAA